MHTPLGSRLVSAARDMLAAPAARETVQVAVPQAAPAAPAAGGGGTAQRSLFEGRGRRPARAEQGGAPAAAGGANGAEPQGGDAALLATAEYTVSQVGREGQGGRMEGDAASSWQGAACIQVCLLNLDRIPFFRGIPSHQTFTLRAYEPGASGR